MVSNISFDLVGVAIEKQDGDPLTNFYVGNVYERCPKNELDSDMISKIIRDKLHDVNLANIEKEFEVWCDENFDVYPMDICSAAVNGNYFKTYIAVADISRELYEDFMFGLYKIDIKNALKVYCLLCVWNTMKYLKEKSGKDRPKLYWRRRMEACDNKTFDSEVTSCKASVRVLVD